jgi:hypothetical protein
MCPCNVRQETTTPLIRGVRVKGHNGLKQQQPTMQNQNIFTKHQSNRVITAINTEKAFTHNFIQQPEFNKTKTKPPKT